MSAVWCHITRGLPSLPLPRYEIQAPEDEMASRLSGVECCRRTYLEWTEESELEPLGPRSKNDAMNLWFVSPLSQVKFAARVDVVGPH